MVTVPGGGQPWNGVSLLREGWHAGGFWTRGKPEGEGTEGGRVDGWMDGCRVDYYLGGLGYVRTVGWLGWVGTGLCLGGWVQGLGVGFCGVGPAALIIAGEAVVMGGC